MPDRVQDLTNHRKVAVACKNYTDKEIKASEERILSIVARNNVDFVDHTDEATYRFTAPANAKLLMLQSIAGNSVKYSPSVASDNNSTHIKTLPSTVYDLDVSKVDGVGYKVNQLVANGNFSDGTGWSANNSTLTVSNNIGNFTVNTQGGNINQYVTPFVEGHKYLVIVSVKLTTATTEVQLFVNGGYLNIYTTATTEWQTLSKIFVGHVGSSSDNNFTVRDRRASDWDNISVSKVNLFDLTADFGSGNEPSTVSDCASAYLSRGINIYEYTPQQSSIKNNAFTGATVEGFNKFDEITELGGINTSDGATNNNVGYIRSKNYNDCLPNTVYYLNASTHSDMGIWFYDSNYNYIQMIYKANAMFTTPTNAKYFKLCWYATTYNNDICINISGSANGTYVPYIQPTTISVDLTTIKDSNNVSLFPSGKLMGNSSVADFITPYNQESRWNEELLKDLTFTMVTDGGINYFVAILSSAKLSGYGIVSKYSFIQYTQTDVSNILTADKTFTITGQYYSGTTRVAIRDDSYTDATTFKNHFTNDDVIQYERATYLTSTTDLTTLTRINAQSNGTITLNNTDNVDMPNLISYNGVIKHALATAVKYESFNIWDEQKELGGYDQNTGAKTSSSITYRNVNPIAVYPSTEYYIKKKNGDAGFVYYYDSNMNYISASYRNTSATFTTPSNCYFINFTSIALTWENETCINISNVSLNGTYKPHKPTYTRALTNNESKYGWGITTGVRNVRTYCDDEGNAVNEGSLVVGNNDLGSDTYTYDSGNQAFYTLNLNDVIKKVSNADIINVLTNNYNAGRWYDLANGKVVYYNDGTTFRLYFKNTNLDSNTTAFKSNMDGVPLFYEKNTTDTETLDDFDYFFDCEEGDTFTIIGCELLQCYATYSFLIKEAKQSD